VNEVKYVADGFLYLCTMSMEHLFLISMEYYIFLWIFLIILHKTFWFKNKHCSALHLFYDTTLIQRVNPLTCWTLVSSFRNHELVVNGGTPFEKGVHLDPTLNLNSMFDIQFSVCTLLLLDLMTLIDLLVYVLFGTYYRF